MISTYHSAGLVVVQKSPTLLAHMLEKWKDVYTTIFCADIKVNMVPFLSINTPHTVVSLHRVQYNFKSKAFHFLPKWRGLYPMPQMLSHQLNLPTNSAFPDRTNEHITRLCYLETNL